LVQEVNTPKEQKAQEEKWEAEGGHPQKRMMRTIDNLEDGTVLCFDCGGDMQPAHSGEMSCQLAYAHGCRGMLLAGNCRDTQYVLKMPDFPMFTFGNRPNALGDFIFADNDGVQLIPRNLVDEVLLRVEATFEKENDEREKIAAGMPIDEVYRVFGVL